MCIWIHVHYKRDGSFKLYILCWTTWTSYFCSYITTWVDSRTSQSERGALTIMFDKYINNALFDAMKMKFRKITPIPENSHIQVCNLLLFLSWRGRQLVSLCGYESTKALSTAISDPDVVLSVGVFVNERTQRATWQSQRNHRTVFRIRRGLGLWRMFVSRLVLSFAPLTLHVVTELQMFDFALFSAP